MYSEGRARRTCQRMGRGVRGSEREGTIKADSEGLGPEKQEKWNCYILMWMGKMGEKKFEGHVSSSVVEYEACSADEMSRRRRRVSQMDVCRIQVGDVGRSLKWSELEIVSFQMGLNLTHRTAWGHQSSKCRYQRKLKD